MATARVGATRQASGSLQRSVIFPLKACKQLGGNVRLFFPVEHRFKCGARGMIGCPQLTSRRHLRRINMKPFHPRNNNSYAVAIPWHLVQELTDRAISSGPPKFRRASEFLENFGASGSYRLASHFTYSPDPSHVFPQRAATCRWPASCEGT
jgi:hypothetical protein